MSFTLHPQLDQDCYEVTDLPLCKLLLMNDANYPWFVLVPRREDKRETHDLEEADQIQLLKESVWLSRTMQDEFKALKMNVAALGNMVPQLHVHHIARFDTDPAWPGPMWGKVPGIEYEEGKAQQLLARWQALATTL